MLLIATQLTQKSKALPQATTTLQVVQCSDGRDELPSLEAADASTYPKLRYVTLPNTFKKIAAGLNVVTERMVTGNYFFRIRSRHCAGYFQAGVLAWHARTLSIALRGSCRLCGIKLFSTENVVMGSLPITPSAGFIVDSGGHKRALDIQDGAYYIERVFPGRYVLRFELHGGFQSEIPLNVQDVGTSSKVQKDIDATTFRRNLGAILEDGSTLKSCFWCY